MTTTPSPTRQDIDALVAFLPRLYADGFAPITRWRGGAEGSTSASTFTFPWPEYDEVVEDFFRLASAACWCDYSYHPNEAGQMLQDEAVVQHADLAQIKTMLTFCVRGERFSDGHWGAMIEGGHIRRLLQRLAELSAQQP